MPADDRRCGGCGHLFDSELCAECGREMLCGSVSVPCPREGCAERVLPEDDPHRFEHYKRENPERVISPRRA